MKKTTLSFIVLLFCNLLIAQNIKDFSAKDTLYYYFKHKKNEYTFKGAPRLVKPPDIYQKKYEVFFDKVNNDDYWFTYFTHQKTNGITVENPVIKKDKRLLKRLKESIITYCDLKRMTKKERENLYWNNYKKVIYIIDKKEKNKDEIYLRKVIWYAGYPIEK